MDKIEDLLDNEIKRKVQDLFYISPNSEEYKEATEGIAKLYELRIEEKQSAGELEIKKKQLAESKKDRYIKIAIDGAGIVLPLVVYSIWMGRGLRFEQTGTYTSRTGQWVGSFFRIRK